MELEKRITKVPGSNSCNASCIAPMTTLLMAGYDPLHTNEPNLDVQIANIDSSKTSISSSVDIEQLLRNVETHNKDSSGQSSPSSKRLISSPCNSKSVEESEPQTSKQSMISQDLTSKHKQQTDAENQYKEVDYSDDSEEIVPLEELDSYISNLKQQKLLEENLGNKTNEEAVASNSAGKDISPSGSFELEISDYESDNDHLEETLQNWKSEFHSSKKSPKKLIAKLRHQK